LVSIGPLKLRNSVILAPMAGVTDAPFRALAWRYGVGLVVSEMVASREVLWSTRKSRLRRVSPAGIRPVAVQVAGGDPDNIAEAAARHWRDGAEIIDINLGCPAKKVCRKAAGSALLGDEALVRRIVASAVAAVPIPVTVKVRTGLSPERRNGVEIARIAEGEGAAAIAVHGRTRACRFQGRAEYDTVARIKAAVGIPVFVNGDIGCEVTARRVLDRTGADGVMIGRGALGAPWLPGRIARAVAEPGLPEKLAVMREHVGLAHAFYGEAGIKIMRKHVKWYLDRLVELGDLDWRRAAVSAFNRLATTDAQLEFVDRLRSPTAA
jgi:tRNA-dihydrouridine synthase B